MKVLSILAVFLFVGCNAVSEQGRPVSFWESQKAKFRYQNKKEFVCDSTLRADLKAKAFTAFRHPLFKSIASDTCYLYSWQERDTSKNEFVILKDAGERGVQLIYYILDKKDNLLSRTKVAGRGGEGEYFFETQSKFKSRDTLSKFAAQTQWYNADSSRKMTPTKGDSSFSYLAVDKNGTVMETVFKEVQELHSGK